MILLLAQLISLILSIECFADIRTQVATPSDMSYGYESDVTEYYQPDLSDVDLINDKYETLMEDLADEEYQVDLGELPVDSDSDMQNFTEFASDLFVSALSHLNLVTADPDDSDSPTEITQAVEDLPMMLMNSFNSGDPDENGYHKNVVVFHGTFNQYECDLVIPYEDYAKLDIIDDHLVNVGSGSVTGKILYDGDRLDPSQYDSYTYILNPVYGNTSSVYNYGSFNYRRHYYLNTSSSYNRISYEDMYGNFTVSDTDVYYSASERLYYLGLVILFIMGVAIICRRQ